MGKNSLDKATLLIRNNCNHSLEIKGQSKWCYKCSLNFIANIPAFKNTSIRVNTTHPSSLSVHYQYNNSDKTKCELQYHFGERGIYLLNVDNNDINCQFKTVLDPIRSNFPVTIFSVILILLISFWNAKKIGINNIKEKIKKKFAKKGGQNENGLPINTQCDTVQVYDTNILVISEQQPLIMTPSHSISNVNTIIGTKFPTLKCEQVMTGKESATEIPYKFTLKEIAAIHKLHNDNDEINALDTNNHLYIDNEDNNTNMVIAKRDAILDVVDFESVGKKIDNPPVIESKSPPYKENSRLTFLDTFRGFSIVMMIFSNYGGGKYWYFNHAPWNGFTITDLVFPFFVFAMGFSFVISLRKKFSANFILNKWKIVRQVIIRSLLLFFLGFIVSNIKAENLLEFRIMGVLQRLAFVYLLLSSILLLPLFPKNRILFRHKLSDILEFLSMALLCSLQLIYIFGKALNCPRGYNNPGGLYDNSSFKQCVGGITGYIDRVILTPKHMYQHPTFKELYMTDIPFDPEGILGTFSATILAYIGARAAKVFVLYNKSQNYNSIMKIWGLSACIMGLIGGLLCNFTVEEGWIPINKNLWSLSYNFVTASLSFLLILVCLFLIRVLRWWDGTPFQYVA
ncbi:unnamed protein product [Gordionus sp. m RMFG-2023]|uniref:heparan-alpha-glucosaminide N-acetyltransferase-like isoform X3 n=1 Tax=Gordionus sp. m RMFG-2023 TaxID=3053472 RepID=UPI0030DEF37E